MTWQDIVLSLGQWIFIIALIPSIISKDKPPFVSSSTTAAILVLYGIIYASLHLWISAASVSLLALAWLILAIQKYREKKSPTVSSPSSR